MSVGLDCADVPIYALEASNLLAIQPPYVLFWSILTTRKRFKSIVFSTNKDKLIACRQLVNIDNQTNAHRTTDYG